MVGAVAALALLSGLFPPGEPGAGRRDAQTWHTRVLGWRLEMRRDRFAAATVCTLRKPGMVYDHGVVTFQFGHQVDTANALFRIDGAPARPVGAVAVKAAGLGARFDGPNLANPSNGAVHIPADDIGRAVRVSIQPNSRMTHRTFDVTGLSSAIEAAKARGCDNT